MFHAVIIAIRLCLGGRLYTHLLTFLTLIPKQAFTPPWTQLAVVVHKERFSSPDRQFNSSGAAYQYFGEGLPSTTGKSWVTAKEDHWLDCGRDPAMEDYILRRILQRCHGEVASTIEPSRAP